MCLRCSHVHIPITLRICLTPITVDVTLFIRVLFMVSMTTVTMVMFVYSSMADDQLLDLLRGSDLYIYQLKGNKNKFMSKLFHNMKT